MKYITSICHHCQNQFTYNAERYHYKANGQQYCSRTCGSRATASIRGRKTDPATIFWSKVDKSGGEDACWLWKASLDPKGYGHWRNSRAHRFSYLLANGHITKKMPVCHKCVNPKHLWLGTAAENIADMWAKGRGLNGGKSCKAKITSVMVLEIRELYATGSYTQKELASMFPPLHHGAIGHIVRRETWKHL